MMTRTNQNDLFGEADEVPSALTRRNDGDYDAAVFFALSLEKAIFVPGIVQYANIRTEEFLRAGGEIGGWLRVINTMMHKS